MKNSRLALSAALLLASGCAAFRPGDAPPSRTELSAMLSDRAAAPFAEIQVSWKNYPFRTAMETIGEGTVSGPKKPDYVPVPREDLSWFRERARAVLGEAGLYSPEKGSGTLELELTTINRWTYRELWRGFLVETAFVFIIPSSLRTGYHLSASFRTPAGETVSVEETAQRKTVFHLLMAPLYPFFAPGPSESGLLKNLLWKVSSGVYVKMKRAAQARAAAPAPPAPQPAPAPQEPQAPAPSAAPAPQEPPAPPAQAAPLPAAAPQPAQPAAPENPAGQQPETDD